MTDHHGRGHSGRRARARLLVPLAALAAASACGNPDAVQLRLQAMPGRELTDMRLTVRAQVAGPATGVQYRWFAVSGICDPQQSDSATTVFTFAEGSTKDRITLEVWRDAKRVGRREMDVALDEQRAKQAQDATRPKVQIEITEIPPYDQYGGTNTRAQISGRVTGQRGPRDVLILYAHADVWYRQPLPDVEIPIAKDGSWTSWTHTGGSYAALLVRHDANFFGRFDVLPAVSGLVLARTMVEGVHK